MRWSEIDTIPCPIAQAMTVIGDAWTMLIVRDALWGATRFDEFQSRTNASRAVVAERLSRLVEHGVMERHQYEAHPPRYEYRLTGRGRALQPVLMVMADWSETHLPKHTRPTGRRHAACGHKFKPVVSCSECGEPVLPGSVTYDRTRASAK